MQCIFPSLEGKEILTHAINVGGPDERSQPQKDTCCVIPLT